MNTIEIDGGRLAYLDEGEGLPLLLLHGFTGTGRTHFEALIADLRRDHRVIAPDLRGYGASQPPGRAFPADFYQRDADDAAALLRALGIEQAVVMGFSDGGESALLVAARHPSQARAVVAWGVCGIISPAMVEGVAEWLPVENWAERRPDWRAEIIANHGEAQFKPIVEGWVQAARAIAAAGGDIVLESAGRIACPALIVNGEREVGNPREAVERLAARIPNCRLVIMPEAGHGVHWDQPERFTALAREFLAGL